MSHTSLTESPKRAPLLIFGTAAATLAGAFLLVAKEPPPPAPVPEPVPVVKPPAPVPVLPVTHLSYADAALQVDAKIDRGHFIAGSNEAVWMDVSVTGVDNKARAPLSAVLVIDRSGSMAGDKIDSARMAADRFVRRLSANDRFAIVSYGTDVSVDMPLTKATRGAKARAYRVVDMIEEGGGTNIDGGLLAARRMLSRANADGSVGRIILISDGRPTEGNRNAKVLARHADKLRDMGASLSTLGVGLDYNEDLMETLATHGGGRYHYLKRARQLGQILNAELTHATSVVARQVALHLPTSLAGFDVVDAPGFRILGNGQDARVLIGDVAAGETLRVLVRLKPKAGTFANANVLLSAPEVVYRKAASKDLSLLAQRSDRFRMLQTEDFSVVEQNRRADVRIRVLQVNSAVELKNSMREYQAGNIDAAIRSLQSNASQLQNVAQASRNVEVEREAKMLDNVLQELRKAAPSSSRGQDIVEAQKARGYQLMR